MEKGDVRFPCRLELRLTEKQEERLTTYAEKAGLTKSEYMRRILDGVVPQERPPVDFYRVLTQMRHISNSCNQVARRANATGYIDGASLQKLAEEFRPLASMLYTYVTLPIKQEKSETELAAFLRQTDFAEKESAGEKEEADES